MSVPITKKIIENLKYQKPWYKANKITSITSDKLYEI